jgi:hypothetical protein
MYASRTGTRRNLDAMRAHGWRLLVSRAGRWRHEGFPYAIDNGAWSDFQNGTAFDDDAFDRLLDAMGAGADWIVLPDIVAGGIASLEMSLRWTNRCLSICPLVLIAVQDGMTEADISPFVGRATGVFLGGSTEWKISTMARWGDFCRRRAIYYHVARVNTARRVEMAILSGANSMDGTSGTRYASTIPFLDNAMKEATRWY